MALVYRGGILQQEESIEERLNRLSAPSSAVQSPLGAVNVGASQDAAKMARSPARRESVLKEQTLRGAERTATPQRSQTLEEAQKQERFKKLSSVGSLSQGVQSKVQQHIAAAGQTAVTPKVDEESVAKQLGFDSAAVAAERLPQFAQILQGLTSLGGLTDQAAREQQLRTLQGLGLQVTSDADAAALFQQVAPTVAGAVAEGVQPSEVTMSMFGAAPTDLGFQTWDEMGAALGVDAATLQGWTVDDVQQQVESLRQEESTAAAALQAQIRGAPPGSVKRMIYERQLADLAQGGAAVVYQNLTDTLNSVNLADKVKIGTNEYDVSSILQDDKLSDLIDNYMSATTDEQREALLPAAQFGDLRDWISENELALGLLEEDIGTAQGAYRQAQKDVSGLGSFSWLTPAAGKQLAAVNLNSQLVATLLDDPNTPEQEFDPSRQYTSQEVAAFRDKLAASPLAQLAQHGDSEILNALTTDDLDDIAGKTADQIRTMHQLGTQLRSDPDLAKYLGVAAGKFFDDTRAADVATAAANLKIIREKHPDLVKDPAFQDLDFAHKNALATDPQAFKTYERFKDLQKLKSADSTEAALDYVFGVGGKEIFNRASAAYNEIARNAGLGDPGALAQLAKFKELFGGDGRPTAESLAHIQQTFGSGSLDTSLQDLLDSPAVAGPSKLKDSAAYTASQPAWTGTAHAELNLGGVDARNFWDRVAGRAADNTLDSSDFLSLVQSYGGNDAAIRTVFDNLASSARRDGSFPKSLDDARAAVTAYNKQQEQTRVAKETSDADAELTSGITSAAGSLQEWDKWKSASNKDWSDPTGATLTLSTKQLDTLRGTLASARQQLSSRNPAVVAGAKKVIQQAEKVIESEAISHFFHKNYKPEFNERVLELGDPFAIHNTEANKALRRKAEEAAKHEWNRRKAELLGNV